MNNRTLMKGKNLYKHNINTSFMSEKCFKDNIVDDIYFDCNF